MGYIDKLPPRLFWNTKELGQRPFKFVIGEKQVIKGNKKEWDPVANTSQRHRKRESWQGKKCITNQ